MIDRPHLFGMLAPDLVAHLATRGVSASEDEARRLLAEAITYGAERLAPRRPVARRLVAAIDEATTRTRLEVLERVTDPADAFVKYLFRAPDGALYEAVRIPLHVPGRFSVCISSQVGCAMGCVFCATGRLGLERNLAPWEMVAQVIAVRDELPAGTRLSSVVFQGQGEPFHNYDAVIQAARVLSDPCGGRIGADNITISTVGLPPQIRRFAREGHRYRLIVSLHSADFEKRRALLPVAGRFSLEEVAAAIREYAAACDDRVTVAWTLMSGVNCGADEAEALARLLEGVPLRFNLIDVNDPRPDGFRRASDEERKAFMQALQRLRAPVVRRYSGGAACEAACGMLASRRMASAVAEK